MKQSISIEQRIENYEKRLSNLKTKAKLQNRKNETRKKAILGALVLLFAKNKSAEVYTRFFEELAKQATRETDAIFLSESLPENYSKAFKIRAEEIKRGAEK